MLSGKIARTKQGKAINKLEVNPKVLVAVKPSSREYRRKRLRKVSGGFSKPSFASRTKPWSWVRIERIQRQITRVNAEATRRAS